ncbi:MAG: D-sedoheptulose 7-phosphate isomerase [Cardiobacteriaceae bacterium]|nr:D-sedoheptulose 7-phosphate isomerase [Cardiobacteriaceae bacterium]
MNWQELIARHSEVFNKLKSQEEIVQKIATLSIETLKNGGSIFTAGNGGSAADAQHFAAELSGRFLAERKPLSGIALSVDTSALTAIANDYGYDEVFARQLAALGREGDLFFGITTSGNSKNILNAVKIAKDRGIKTVGLTGRDGGKLAKIADISLVVPSDITAHIQEAHIFAIHYFCSEIDKEFAK